MLCQNCGKNEANIRYTQIINGVKKELALCSNCAKELGMDRIEMPDFPISFNSFLGDFFNDYAENEFLPSIQSTAIKCKTCGMTYNDFIKDGIFGCAECYNTFSSPISSLLKNLHGTAKHIGRSPKQMPQITLKENKNVNKEIHNETTQKSKENNILNEKEDKIKKLQNELDIAIKEERYEDAAKIRDQIKEMNK